MNKFDGDISKHKGDINKLFEVPEYKEVSVPLVPDEYLDFSKVSLAEVQLSDEYLNARMVPQGEQDLVKENKKFFEQQEKEAVEHHEWWQWYVLRGNEHA